MRRAPDWGVDTVPRLVIRIPASDEVPRFVYGKFYQRPRIQVNHPAVAFCMQGIRVRRPGAFRTRTKSRNTRDDRATAG